MHALSSEPTLSAWQDPPHILSDYRSSEVLEDCDVVIIGSGLTGTSIAHHIIAFDSNKRVTIVEARGLCSSATGRNGGHLTCDLYQFSRSLRDAGFTKQQIADHADFEIANFNALSRFIEKESIACEYARKSHYDVAFSQEEFAQSLRNLELMRRCNENVAANVRVFSNPEASEMAGIRCEGLIVHDYSASIHAYKLVTSMTERLLRKGVKLYTHTPVLSVKNGYITTSGGSFRARQVVYATNAYTAALLPELSDEIIPVRGQVMAHHW